MQEIGFFFALDRNLEDVHLFYNRKYADAARRLKLLQDQYGKSLSESCRLDQDETEDLVGALLELRNSLRKLQWYGEVNRRGFIKITKKLDKKVPRHGQGQYIELKVDTKPFATNNDVLELMKTANDWLSKLGDIKGSSNKDANHVEPSVPRASAKAVLDVPQHVWERVEQVIREDDASALPGAIEATGVNNYDLKCSPHQRSLLNLLQRAISCRSEKCIFTLLPLCGSLKELDDINQRNCLHRMVISMNRSRQADEDEKRRSLVQGDSMTNGNYITPAAPPLLSGPSRNTHEIEEFGKIGKQDTSVSLFASILSRLSENQRCALQARDSSGRLPLHYAAQYGFIIIVQTIISHMQSWGQFEIAHGIDAPFWQDLEGLSPLHLSITGGHLKTTKALLEAEAWRGEDDRKGSVKKHMGKSGEVLLLATKLNFYNAVKLLVEADVDLNYQDEQGETALHVASRFGHSECAKLLLDGTAEQKASTEIPEQTFGWTPLFIACVDGQLEVVELLIKAGAELGSTDYSGWTAREHASLRGHMAIARLIAKHSPMDHHANGARPPSPIGSSLTDRKSNTSSTNSLQNSEPVKTFGHRYLTDESMILVSIGTMDMRKNVEAVNLDRIPLAEAHLTQLDTTLSLVVQASGAKGEPSIVDLPVQDSINTEPIVFTAKDHTKVKLLFDIVPTYAGTKDRIVGRGVALLSTAKPNIGSNRITLQGDVAAPIIASHNMEVIGSVHFNFLIITPFSHPKMTVTEDHTYWKSITSPMVIGHRGRVIFFLSVCNLIFTKVWGRINRLGRRCSWGRTPFRYAVWPSV